MGLYRRLYRFEGSICSNPFKVCPLGIHPMIGKRMLVRVGGSRLAGRWWMARVPDSAEALDGDPFLRWLEAR